MNVENTFYTYRPATAPWFVMTMADGYEMPDFPTRDQAEQEARRLADLNPGINFYVLGAVSITSVPKPLKATTRSLV